MKKIVIDARESGTSTGRYIDKLIEYLHKIEPAFSFIILTKVHRLEFMRRIAPRFEVVESTAEEFTFNEQIGLKKRLDALAPNLVHFGIVQQPVFYRRPTVTTMHDLTTVRFKNPDKNPLVFTLKQQIYKWVNKRVARKSKVIFTPSQFVKNDVATYTGVSPDKIVVTYEAADPIVEKPEPMPELVGKQFIMYVGRPMPHKNLERLIEAFVILQNDHSDLWLVLAGKKDNNYARIEQMTNDRQIANVAFTDFVTDSQLRWLYENCAAYVFPSLSEGFGLPGLEAMMHGAPVVSSNATCLPEIYGDAAHYFDPLDVAGIATAVGDVLTDTKLRESLIRKGSMQVKKYSWRRMAEQTLALYAEVLAN